MTPNRRMLMARFLAWLPAEALALLDAFGWAVGEWHSFVTRELDRRGAR